MVELRAYPLCLLSFGCLLSVNCGEAVDEPDRPPESEPGHVDINTREPNEDIVAAVNCRAMSVAETVTIDSEAYSPEEVTVEKGSVIEWRNERDDTVTVTSGDEKHSGTVFDSGKIAAGESYCFEFKMAGSFHYYSKSQGSSQMSGVLRIEPEWR